MRGKYWLMAVLGLCAPVQALSPLGPPVARLDVGQWELAAVHACSKQDVDLESGATWADFRIDTTWFEAGVGLVAQRAELFGRVGVVEMDNESTDAAVGVGGRITTNSGQPVSWGFVGQVSFYTGDDSEGAGVDKVSTEVDAYEIQVGVGPCWHPDGFLLFGGPCFTSWGGEMVRRSSGVRRSAEFDNDLDFGGYLGFALDVWKNLAIGAEYQQTSEAYLVSGHVAWSF